MDNSNRKILRFKNGEETYPTIMTEDELAKSPFYHTVSSAIDSIEKFSKGIESIKGCDFSKFKHKIQNNIIAFLGNRGSGKTSCMRTTTNICRNKHADWLILDEIDPSFFDDTHNILDIFIGTLYGIFKKEMKNWECLSRCKQDELRKINDDFRKVKSALRYVKGNIEFENEYETDELLHLDEGVRLNQLLYNLISGLLKYKNKNFLLVSIDDLDLNISCSYEMLEQLRKYLMLPNVAIIIAARFDQLFDNICVVLTKHYKDIPARVSQKDVAEMAERYLNKVLPLSRRCEMPLVDSYMDAIMLLDDEEDDSNKDSERLVSVRVPDIIFRKTRYLFYNTAGIPSLVIPRNLRDLRMLVSMLLGMEDYIDENKTNQEVFKNYFFNEWMGIIEPEYRPFIRRLLDEDDLSKLNRFVVSNLYELFLKEDDPWEQLAQEVKDSDKQNLNTTYARRRNLLSNILNPRNSYWNMSVGDVVTIMNAVRDRHDSAQIFSLLFVITSFYSIKLYETYNLMTDMTGKEGLTMPTEQTTSNPELKTSIRADIPSYFRLVGGAFFASSGDSFIPMGAADRESREKRIINAGALMPEIRSVVKEYKELINTKGSKIPDMLKARLRMCEFFMLTVAERADLKRGIDRRLINEPLYFSPFGTTAKNLVFDVTRPFLSGVYPKFAYDRFNNEIYDIALKEEDSILNRMRNHGISREKNNVTWELMSKASIRNMEILEDLTAWMNRIRDYLRPGSNGILGALTAFYDEFDIVQAQAKGSMPTKGYCVKTYSKSSKADKGKNAKNAGLPYYRIDYSIYAELGKFLKELDETSVPKDAKEMAKKLKNIFDAIMSEKDILILKDEYDKAEVREALYPFCGHSIVDLTMGTDDGKISLTDLSVVLAEITLEYRYDFRGFLPKGLEFHYNATTLTHYSTRKKNLQRSKEDKEDSISDIKESLKSMNEDLKALKQEMAQFKKNIVAVEKESNKLDGEMTAIGMNLMKLNSLDEDEFTPPQITAHKKKVETLNEKMFSISGKIKQNQADSSVYGKHLRETEERIKSVENNITSANRDIRQLERQIKEVDAKIERLDNNFNKRTAI